MLLFFCCSVLQPCDDLDFKKCNTSLVGIIGSSGSKKIFCSKSDKNFESKEKLNSQLTAAPYVKTHLSISHLQGPKLKDCLPGHQAWQFHASE